MPARTSAYLVLDVVKRIWRVDGKAYQDDVRLGVGERSQAFIVFLPCRVP